MVSSLHGTIMIHMWIQTMTYGRDFEPMLWFQLQSHVCFLIQCCPKALDHNHTIIGFWLYPFLFWQETDYQAVISDEQHVPPLSEDLLSLCYCLCTFSHLYICSIATFSSLLLLYLIYSYCNVCTIHHLVCWCNSVNLPAAGWIKDYHILTIEISPDLQNPQTQHLTF